MKRNKKTLIYAAAYAACATLLSGAWTGKRLTYTDMHSWYPTVAASGDYVYVTWQDCTPGNEEIFFLRSTDNGSTWDGKIRLTDTSGTSSNPQIAASGAYVYVVWEEKIAGSYEVLFRRSTDNGATWDNKKQLTDNAGYSIRVQIAVSGANVYVAWEDNTPGNWEIYFLRSTDNGSTWKTEKRMTDTAEDSEYPDIAVDGDHVYLVWLEWVSGSKVIYMRKSEDRGATWGAARNLTLAMYTCNAVKIAAAGSNVYLAFRCNVSGDPEITFMKSADYGGAWSAMKQLTDVTGSQSVTLGGIAAVNAKVYVAWDEADENIEVYCRKAADHGDTWKGAQRLTYNDGFSESADVCLGAENVYVAYYDTTPGNSEIYLKYKPH